MDFLGRGLILNQRQRPSAGWYGTTVEPAAAADTFAVAEPAATSAARSHVVAAAEPRGQHELSLDREVVGVPMKATDIITYDNRTVGLYLPLQVDKPSPGWPMKRIRCWNSKGDREPFKPINETWMRANIGTSIVPCFDAEAETVETSSRVRRWLWNTVFLIALGAAATWPIWGGR